MNVNVDAAEKLFWHIFCICYILSCLDCKVLVQLFFTHRAVRVEFFFFYHACFYVSAAEFVLIA